MPSTGRLRNSGILVAELGNALRREAGNVSQYLCKSLHVRRQIEAFSGPRSTHFELIGARWATNLPKSNGRGRGDGATQVGVVGAFLF